MTKRSISRIALSATLAFSAIGISQAQWDYKTDVKRQISISAINCSGCDLTGQDYNGTRMKNSDLSGAILNRVNLSGGSIYNSNLSGAHLRKAFLVRVKGEKVFFNGANLNNSTLTELELSDSYFSEATLGGVEFHKAKIQGSEFKKANLGRITALAASFTNCDFEKARFNGANLTEVDFSNSTFVETEFGNAILSEATLTGANFSGAKMASVSGLTQSQLDDACGDGKTELPIDLTITYCVDIEEGGQVHEAADHAKMAARDQEIARRTERAIRQIESLMQDATPDNRRTLQRVHGDLLAIQRKIEE